MSVRILIADDQEMLREGLALILATEPDLAIVGHAADGVEAVALARALQPDVVLMDIRMPRLDGIEATARITAALPTCKVIILTSFDEDEYVLEALRCGAVGFVLKAGPRSALVHAVRAAGAGTFVLDPDVAQRLAEQSVQRRTKRRASPPAGLTAKELEVLEAVADGLTNTEIARRLHIAETTVKTHIGRLLTKLNARDRVHLVLIHRDL